MNPSSPSPTPPHRAIRRPTSGVQITVTDPTLKGLILKLQAYHLNGVTAVGSDFDPIATARRIAALVQGSPNEAIVITTPITSLIIT